MMRISREDLALCVLPTLLAHALTEAPFDRASRQALHRAFEMFDAMRIMEAQHDEREGTIAPRVASDGCINGGKHKWHAQTERCVWCDAVPDTKDTRRALRRVQTHEQARRAQGAA